MAFTPAKLVVRYRRRAKRYDLAVRLFSLAGVSLARYRRLTIAALRLRPGDAVVDLGCGTGLNFPYLEEAVGPSGRIVGVDLSDAMLARAQGRVDRAAWRNIELVHGDVAAYQFPTGLGGILSTLALTLSPSYDEVIRRGAAALRPGGRLAVCDLKRPEHWPEWLVRYAAWLNRPFGVTLDLAERHPWESVRRHLREIEFRELYGGAMYLSVGERRADDPGTGRVGR